MKIRNQQTLKGTRRWRSIANVFCPTGKGGGVNPTCSPGGARRTSSVPGASQAAASLHEEMARRTGLSAHPGGVSMHDAVNVGSAGGEIGMSPGEQRLFKAAMDKDPRDWTADDAYIVKTVAHESAHALGRERSPGFLPGEEQFGVVSRPVPSSTGSGQKIKAGVELFMEEAAVEILSRDFVGQMRGTPWNFKREAGAYQQYVLGLEGLARHAKQDPAELARKLKTQTTRERLVTIGKILGAATDADALTRGQEYATEVLSYGNDFPVKKKDFKEEIKRISGGQRPVANAKRDSGRGLLRVDPTRTQTVRRHFATKLRQKFARLRLVVVELVEGEDALGLRRARPVANQRWLFNSDPDKLRAFSSWLRTQFADLTGASEEEVWQRYILDGYRRGAGRAFGDTTKRRGKGREPLTPARREFLRTAFSNPAALDKIQMLASRAFEELAGVTDVMATRMRRVLADALVTGQSPREAARLLAREVDLGKGRALLVAQTELIRAHAEGQLNALEQMGVAEVGVQVEWLATKDRKTCPRCRAMEGVVLSIKEARGKIPAHPRCRCSWIPNIGDTAPARKQVGKRSRRKAARQPDLDDFALEINTPWLPLANVFCATGPGGGVNPTCSPGQTGGASKPVHPFAPAEYRRSAAHREGLAATYRTEAAAARAAGDTAKADLYEGYAHQSEEKARGFRAEADKLDPPKPRKGKESKARTELIAGPGSANLTDAQKSVRTEGLERKTEELFGRRESDGRPDVASAVGAPDNATVRAEPVMKYGTDQVKGVSIRVSHEEYTASRTAYVDEQGRKVMKNEAFFAFEGGKGTGLGTKVLGDQIQNLRDMGFDRIETWAARGKGMNGYYTWAALGYDQDIKDFPKGTAKKLQNLFPGAKSVQDIMAAKEIPGLTSDQADKIRKKIRALDKKLGKPERPADFPITGRDYWQANGVNMHHAYFDLKDGSRSMQVFEEYVAKRKASGRVVRNLWATFPEELAWNEVDDLHLDDTAPPPSRKEAEEIDLSPEDWEALERAWQERAAGPEIPSI